MTGSTAGGDAAPLDNRHFQVADLVQMPEAPAPDPVPGAVDSRVQMGGDDYTLRAWPPGVGPKAPGEWPATHVWEADTPGWRF